MTLEEARSRVDAALARYTAARESVRMEKVAVAAARERQRVVKEAQAIAQAVAQAVQEEAHRRIADIVSRSLAAVFDEPYEFRIRFDQKRGRTEASLVFVREGREVDPMTAAGGGVVDVAAFALRLSCLMLSRPPLRRMLVLDEPFKFVSAGYRDRVRSLIESLAHELDCKFLIVTHLEELRCGAIVEL